MMCTVRIIMSSPTLRHAALEYRPHAVNAELAKRLGVDVESRTLRLTSAMWGSVIMTALSDLADDGVDWEHLGTDDIVARLEETFIEFIDVIGNVPPPP